MRRLLRRPFRVTAASALAIAIAGCAASPSSDHLAKRDSASGKPTPAASTSHPSSPAMKSPFASLATYLAHRSGTVTAAVYDARTGRTWVYDPGVLEHTASIVKVQIMGTALWEAENSGKPLPSAEAGLMIPMIEYSDNTAATELLTDVGGPDALLRFDRRAGLDHTAPSKVQLIPGTDLPGWGLTTTTALDQVLLVRTFAYPNPLLSESDRQHGLTLMEHVEDGQNWGISGGVPVAGTTIALKNGWLPLVGYTSDWQINSIGWIKGHGRNYVLAVLTEHNPSEQYGIDTIQAIAARIFSELGPRSGT
jgi:Beta-lactamase enzyme family